jgi:hypothetical protein
LACCLPLALLDAVQDDGELALKLTDVTPKEVIASQAGNEGGESRDYEKVEGVHLVHSFVKLRVASAGDFFEV